MPANVIDTPQVQAPPARRKYDSAALVRDLKRQSFQLREQIRSLEAENAPLVRERAAMLSRAAAVAQEISRRTVEIQRLKRKIKAMEETMSAMAGNVSPRPHTDLSELYRQTPADLESSTRVLLRLAKAVVEAPACMLDSR